MLDILDERIAPAVNEVLRKKYNVELGCNLERHNRVNCCVMAPGAPLISYRIDDGCKDRYLAVISRNFDSDRIDVHVTRIMSTNNGYNRSEDIHATIEEIISALQPAHTADIPEEISLKDARSVPARPGMQCYGISTRLPVTP